MRTVDEFYAGRQVTQRQAQRFDLRAIAQEAVRAEALTGEENWDWFSRYIEAAIKAETRNGEQFIAKMRAPFTPDDEMQRLKMAAVLSDCRLATLNEVLMLPKLLKTQGEKARATIAEMERDAA